MDTRVSAAMNENLLKEFTEEEVKKMLFSIGDLKAPESYGMPSIFSRISGTLLASVWCRRFSVC
jgi:hypothetical protein